MIEITDVSLSRQTAKTGENVILTIGIRETIDYPYDYSYDYPVAWTGVALSEGAK